MKWISPFASLILALCFSHLAFAVDIIFENSTKDVIAVSCQSQYHEWAPHYVKSRARATFIFTPRQGPEGREVMSCAIVRRDVSRDETYELDIDVYGGSAPTATRNRVRLRPRGIEINGSIVSVWIPSADDDNPDQ